MHHRCLCCCSCAKALQPVSISLRVLLSIDIALLLLCMCSSIVLLRGSPAVSIALVTVMVISISLAVVAIGAAIRKQWKCLLPYLTVKVAHCFWVVAALAISAVSMVNSALPSMLHTVNDNLSIRLSKPGGVAALCTCLLAVYLLLCMCCVALLLRTLLLIRLTAGEQPTSSQSHPAGPRSVNLRLDASNLASQPSQPQQTEQLSVNYSLFGHYKRNSDSLLPQLSQATVDSISELSTNPEGPCKSMSLNNYYIRD